MNKIIPLLSVFCLLYSCTGSDKSYILSITEQHKQYAASFTDTTQSPLDSAEQITFKGVSHFMPDKNYKVTAKVLWLPYTGIVELPHSRGDFRPYFQAAQLNFTIYGNDYSLIGYQNEKMRTQRILFVPFADVTNGNETYGGGRYMDISYMPNASETVMDFNLSYYPYCAYSHRYSCPIVPKENSLDIAIRAGERNID